MADNSYKDWKNKNEYIQRGGNVFVRDMDGRKSIRQVPPSNSPFNKK